MLAKRNSRIILAALTALLMALSLTSLAWAGGWAVVTLDKMPENVTAGEPYTIGFMVRQHGRTPIEVDQIPILARQVETKQTVTFTALPDDVIGHYQAELLFPEPGAWEWSVSTGLFPERQPMPVLQVASTGVVAGNAAENSGPVNAPSPARGIFSTGISRGIDRGIGRGIPGSLLGGLALLSLAGGVALLARSREKRIGMLAGAGLLVLSGALAFAFFSTVNAGVTAAPKSAAPEAVTGGTAASAQMGQQLFLAKGCVVCHVNTRAVQNAAEYSVQMGPNLSTYRNDPEYLHSFLKDPASVRPDIEMPDLGLSKVEIDALVAFLNSD